jgi:hypothetical protein
MIEDFNFLQSHINKYCSFIPLLEKRTGISINQELKKIKNEINMPQSREWFVNVVNRSLKILNDGHTRIADKKQIKACIPNDYLASVGNASLSDTLHADYYQSIAEDSIYSRIKCGFWVKYIDGKYVIFKPFTFNGEHIPSGTIIKNINGIPINRFVNDRWNQMNFPLWDDEKKLWYDEGFMYSLPQMNMQQFTLNFGDKKIDFNCSVSLDSIFPLPNQTYSHKMLIINKSILYVFMPSMTDGDWYIREFQRIYNQNITKIIIDIRGNGGGSDGMWAKFLQKIIDKPIKYNYCVGFNHDMKLEKAISSFGKIQISGKKAMIQDSIMLMPDSNSVHFKGNFYIFQNKYTYSAASALASVAMQIKNMKVVGESSARILGYTFPAILFRLPNSGIVFDLAFSYDLTGGSGNKYMDKVGIPLNLNIEEYIDKVKNYDYHGDDYLKNKDKFIQYVIND